MRKHFLLLVIVFLCYYSYAQMPSTFPTNKANFEQKFKFEVDKKETVLNENVHSLTSFFGSSLLMITILENKKDLKFTFAVSMKELKKGTYIVNVCNAADECDDSQAAIYVPGKISSVSFPKSGGYNTPNLNLKPLEFVISSVEDANFPGAPLKAKRIRGNFNGVFATIEEGKIIGSVVPVKGEFDICSVITDK